MTVNAVEVIKNALNMESVINKYGFEYRRRMPCPIHGGKNNNFDVKEKTFYCHSRCGGGDVITFVQKLFELDFKEALKKIDSDFGLNIYGATDFETYKQMAYKLAMQRAKLTKEKCKKEKAENEYWKAFDEWKRLFDNIRQYKPKSENEEPHPLFVEGIKNISKQEYIVDCLDERRRKSD